MANQTARGVLLAAYFNRRALSMISATPTFKLKSVQFGAGFLDTSVSPALVKEIPITAVKSDITNVYTDNSPTFFYDSTLKQVKVRTEIPVGAAGIPAGGANVNVACILDEQGNAVAMLAGQPTVVNTERGYVVTGIIETELN
jgi:hypothetical protein